MNLIIHGLVWYLGISLIVGAPILFGLYNYRRDTSVDLSLPQKFFGYSLFGAPVLLGVLMLKLWG